MIISRYRKRKFFKKFLHAFITLFMCFVIAFIPVSTPLSSPVVTEASAIPFAKIAKFILSATGLVNIGTNGRVGKASGSVVDGLIEKISDAWGVGVYLDSNGNYVFSNDFTQNVLSYLSGQSDINYRVLSDFNPPSNFSGVWENSQYLSPTFLQRWRDNKSKYSKYISVLMFRHNADYSWNTSNCVFYDVSDVAFISTQDGGSTPVFYDNNLNRKTVPFTSFQVEFSSNRYYDSDVYVSENYNFGAYGSSGYISIIPWDDTAFINYPFYTYNTGSHTYSYEFDSNRSFIIAKSVAAGNSAINRNSGNIINNYYTSFPSVTQNYIDNNDWDAVYNNYVTNVSNTYNMNNTSDGLDMDLVREIMDQYSQTIMDAIYSGDVNIIEEINYTNEWLQRIYNKLDIIVTLMETNSGSSAVVSDGGSSCAWSDEDILSILSDIDNVKTLLNTNNSYLLALQNRVDVTNNKLDSILSAITDNSAKIDITNNYVSSSAALLEILNTNTYSSVTELQQLYTLLSNVYDAILEIDSGSGYPHDVTVNVDLSLTGSSAYLYANSTSSGWNLLRSDNPTYYHIYDVSKYHTLKLTTSGGTRTRILLSDYPTDEFLSNISQSTLFSMDGYGLNLSDTVTDYTLNNSNGYKYLYVYLGNADGISDVVGTKTVSNGGSGSGGGTGVIPPDLDPYNDWFEVLHNLPQADLNSIFSKFDILKNLIQNTAPFVMLGVITVTINSFKAEPVKPEFSIPVKLSNNIIDIDESIDIDLSIMDSILPLLKDLILILWTIGLLMFSWWLIPKIYLIIQ